jgi:predicted CoA-binding protein
MPELSAQARQQFWKRPGTFAIVGSFEAPGKLSWWLLEQCQKQGISAVPVNADLTNEVLGVKPVADPAQIDPLAGIVCVRLDPYATAAVEKAAELGVPVWLSMRVGTPSALALAEKTGVDFIATVCPLLYTSVGSFHSIHRVIAKVFGQY